MNCSAGGSPLPSGRGGTAGCRNAPDAAPPAASAPAGRAGGCAREQGRAGAERAAGGGDERAEEELAAVDPAERLGLLGEALELGLRGFQEIVGPVHGSSR